MTLQTTAPLTHTTLSPASQPARVLVCEIKDGEIDPLGISLGNHRPMRRGLLREYVPIDGATGYEALNQPLTEAARVDPKVTVADALRRLTEADEAAERGELAAAVERMTGGQG